MRLRRLLCLLNGHKPHRDRVNWDGVFHTGPCRYCGDVVRYSKQGFWKRILPSDV